MHEQPRLIKHLSEDHAESICDLETLHQANAAQERQVDVGSKSSTAQQVPGMRYSECFGSRYCDNGVVYRDIPTVGQIAIRGMPSMVQTNNTAKSYGIRSGNLGLNIDRKGMWTQPTRLPTWFETTIPLLDGDFAVLSDQFQFCFIGASKYIGEIVYGAVTTTGGMWTIQVQGAGAGYDDAKFHEKKSQVAVDRGSGGGTISRAVAVLYWRGVPGSKWDGGWNTFLYPCGRVLPDFVIMLADGRKYLAPYDKEQPLLDGAILSGVAQPRSFLVPMTASADKRTLSYDESSSEWSGRGTRKSRQSLSACRSRRFDAAAAAAERASAARKATSASRWRSATTLFQTLKYLSVVRGSSRLLNGLDGFVLIAFRPTSNRTTDPTSSYMHTLCASRTARPTVSHARWTAASFSGASSSSRQPWNKKAHRAAEERYIQARQALGPTDPAQPRVGL
ncbi:hypothetical protein N657DRAFT_682818 [Parathielavia appendiculata]|uniref:Uncharacterized protein n=1 Tax=Parathielavia appendiculata TaxID=2587402 RepID=A0AAN6TUV2_9PEZI|nr:hypothetical protein N657DRAFT_682818 [Parathielavia appendiculata]